MSVLGPSLPRPPSSSLAGGSPLLRGVDESVASELPSLDPAPAPESPSSSGKSAESASSPHSLKSTTTSSSRLAPEAARRSALVLACLITFGVHCAKAFLPTLKPFFVDPAAAAGAPASGLSMSSFEFGTLLSAVAWPNLFVLPFSVGLFVDSHGADRGAVVMTALALLGHVLFCVSLGDGARAHLSWLGALLGRVLFGLGLGGSGVVSGAILGEWWGGGGRHLTFAIGVAESSQHTASFCGKLLPNFLADSVSPPSPMFAMWVASLFLLLGCGAALMYLVLSESVKFSFALAVVPRTPLLTLAAQQENYAACGEPHRQHPRHEHEREHEQPAQRGSSSSSSHPSSNNVVVVVDEKSYFDLHLSAVRGFPRMFWYIGVMHMMFSNTANLFAGFATAFFVEEYGLTPQAAAVLASVDALVPVFLSPVVGHAIDKFGFRLHMCAVSALVSLVAFALLWGHTATPLLPMLLLSISCSTTPTLIKSTIPLVTPAASAGQAFAIFYCFESLAQSLGHMVLGRMRDEAGSYESCLLALCVVCVLAFLAAAMVYVEDRRAVRRGRPSISSHGNAVMMMGVR